MAENDIDSLENSTENTKKRILPNRPGRGKLMKLLQEKEPDEEDELYNMIFAEKSSDEEFNPSHTELSEDSKNSQEKVSDLEENSEKEHVSKVESEISIEEELPKHTRPRPKIKMIKKENRARESKTNRNKKEIDEILDIDLLDIDKIDEIEEMKDKGIFPHEISSEEVSDDEDEEESFGRGKKKKVKSKKKPMNKANNINLYNTNQKVVEYPTLSRKSYRKTFIDDEEPDTFMKKRQRPFTKKIKKKEKTSRKFFPVNSNVVYNRDDPDTIIINKAVFDDENSNDFGQDKEDDIMEYNDEFFKDQQKQNIQFEEDNKKIIKKFNKIPEKTEGAVVKYNFMQEKLSQKDLLIEAIFTEYYNIQSLQEMQRLDDLKKKEMPTQGRREFTEYVRIVKRMPNVNLQKKVKVSEEKLEGGVIPNTEEIEKINEELVEHSMKKEISKNEENKFSEMFEKVEEKVLQENSNGKILSHYNRNKYSSR